MFNRIVIAIAAVLATILLAGCAGQSVCVAAQGQRNTGSFVVGCGVIPVPPTPQAKITIEKEPDGKYYAFKRSCKEVGHRIGYFWENGDDGKKVRNWKCQDKEGQEYIALREWIDNTSRAGDELSRYCQPNGCNRDQYGRWYRL